MTDDPWKDIAPPSSLDAVNAKRVDPDITWGFFWGRALDRKCLFMLTHAPDTTPGGKLPVLKGIEINDVVRGNNLDRVLMFKLNEDTHRDIFERLCRDIVASAGRAASEREAVAVTLARTWRWHHLLSGGTDGKLGLEEQKGLVGELLLMERHLLNCLSPREVLDAWHGPLGSPKDFEIGRLCVEVKARRGAATPHSHQFGRPARHRRHDELFLYIVELDQAPADTFQASLGDLAAQIRTAFSVDSVGLLDRLLAAAVSTGWTTIPNGDGLRVPAGFSGSSTAFRG